MKKQKKISALVSIFFIIQCLSLGVFVSNSYAATTTYEAETATLARGAAVYNGTYVGNLGNNNVNGVSDSGTMSLKISVSTSGVYNIGILYRSGENRNLWISVNNKNGYCPGIFNSGSWNTWSTKICSIYLPAGTNTVLFYNNEGNAPDIDKITVSSGQINTDTPSVPTHVVASYSGNGTIVSWDYSTVSIYNAPITYSIYRNNTLIGTTNYTTFSQENVPTGVYTYKISAKCTLNNTTSAQSSAAGVIVSGTPLLKNADFEQNLNDWTKKLGSSGTSAITFEPGKGINGSDCISISSTSPDHTCLVQTVTLQPNKPYILFANVKAENINVFENKNVGPTISVYNTWTRADSPAVFNNYDWKQIVMNFQAPANGVVEIACNLGYWYNTTNGKAYFDNIVLAPDNSVERKDGSYVYLNLEKTDTTAITSANYSKWVSRLDSAYVKYQELVGTLPFNGDKMGILSVHQNPGGWAVAGNPIIWGQSNVKSELQNINNYDTWSFGILHEIGHNYDVTYAGTNKNNCGWNFDAEFWANTKMYYVVEQLNAKVDINSGTYIGSQLMNYYESIYLQNLGKTSARVYNNDSLTFCFIRMKQLWGTWEPFKATFREFVSKGYNPSTRIDKFNKFLEVLQSYNKSPISVENTFEPGELDFIRNYFIKNPN